MDKNYDLSEKLNALVYAKRLVRFDADREAIKLLANKFDDNYYGEDILKFGKQVVDIESVWTDDTNEILIHVNSKYYEADVRFVSMSKTNQFRVIDMLLARLKTEFKERGCHAE